MFVLCSKNQKVQKRGKINLVGRLQLSTERSKEEDNEGIVQLRILRVQVRTGTHATHVLLRVKACSQVSRLLVCAVCTVALGAARKRTTVLVCSRPVAQNLQLAFAPSLLLKSHHAVIIVFVEGRSLPTRKIETIACV